MIEFWTVEDTGWSNGISWFRSGGTDVNPLRFKSYDAAYDYAKRKKEEFNQPATKWRVVHTTIERSETKQVTTNIWTIV